MFLIFSLHFFSFLFRFCSKRCMFGISWRSVLCVLGISIIFSFPPVSVQCTLTCVEVCRGTLDTTMCICLQVYSVDCHVYTYKVYTDSVQMYSVYCHVYTYTVYTDSIHVYSRPCPKAPLVMKQLLPTIFLFHLIQSFKFFCWKILLTFFLLWLTF